MLVTILKKKKEHYCISFMQTGIGNLIKKKWPQDRQNHGRKENSF